MATKEPPKGSSGHKYSPEETAEAVRLVRQLRSDLGTDRGTVGRVAGQLGYGEESVRTWLKQVDIDQAKRPDTIKSDAERALEQENKELKRAKEILRRASVFSQRSSTAPQK
jgi:transposase-like protein